jgi:hypothetical protein
MKEILQKAEIRRWGKPKERVDITHLSPTRELKNQKYIDDVRKQPLFLLKYEFIGP